MIPYPVRTPNLSITFSLIRECLLGKWLWCLAYFLEFWIFLKFYSGIPLISSKLFNVLWGILNVRSSIISIIFSGFSSGEIYSNNLVNCYESGSHISLRTLIGPDMKVEKSGHFCFIQDWSFTKKETLPNRKRTSQVGLGYLLSRL
jgi:hypothetical protein